MNDSKHTSRSAGSAPAPAPFGGLGFSLGSVQETARCLTIVSLPAAVEGQCRAVMPDVPRLSGYGLLTALGREIRGR